MTDRVYTLRSGRVIPRRNSIHETRRDNGPEAGKTDSIRALNFSQEELARSPSEDILSSTKYESDLEPNAEQSLERTASEDDITHYEGSYRDHLRKQKGKYEALSESFKSILEGVDVNRSSRRGAGEVEEEEEDEEQVPDTLDLSYSELLNYTKAEFTKTNIILGRLLRKRNLLGFERNTNRRKMAYEFPMTTAHQCIPEYFGNAEELIGFTDQIDYFASQIPENESQAPLITVVMGKLRRDAAQKAAVIRASTWNAVKKNLQKTFGKTYRMDEVIAQMENLEQRESELFGTYCGRALELKKKAESYDASVDGQESLAARSLKGHFINGLRNRELKRIARAQRQLSLEELIEFLEAEQHWCEQMESLEAKTERRKLLENRGSNNRPTGRNEANANQNQGRDSFNLRGMREAMPNTPGNRNSNQHQPTRNNSFGNNRYGGNARSGAQQHASRQGNNGNGYRVNNQRYNNNNPFQVDRTRQPDRPWRMQDTNNRHAGNQYQGGSWQGNGGNRHNGAPNNQNNYNRNGSNFTNRNNGHRNDNAGGNGRAFYGNQQGNNLNFHGNSQNYRNNQRNDQQWENEGYDDGYQYENQPKN